MGDKDKEQNGNLVLMKIISYNLNGIRAALKKDFVQWLKAADPDVVCLQETKAMQEQVDMTEIEALGYKHYWFSAQKKGRKLGFQSTFQYKVIQILNAAVIIGTNGKKLRPRRRQRATSDHTTTGMDQEDGGAAARTRRRGEGGESIR